MERHSTQQVNTRKHRMTTKLRGEMSFLKFGQLTREVTTAELADGNSMSGGKTGTQDVEASFYAADTVLAGRLERWVRAYEAGAADAYESSTHQYLRTNGSVAMRVGCEQIAATKITYPEMDQEDDGRAGMCTVTFKYFNANRLDV